MTPVENFRISGSVVAGRLGLMFDLAEMNKCFARAVGLFKSFEVVGVMKCETLRKE